MSLKGQEPDSKAVEQYIALHGKRFDDALMGCCRVNLPEREARLREYLLEFALTALGATSDGKHQKIHELAVVRCIAIGQHSLDDENAALGRQSLTALTQDCDCVVIDPVVQDVRQHIDIVSGWKSLEEIAGTECTAPPETRCRNIIARVFFGLWQIEQNPGHLRMSS